MTDQSPAPGAQQPPTPPAGGAWQAAPPAPVPGTPGFVYADVPNRIIAYIIDAIIVGIVSAVVGAVLDGIFGPSVKINGLNLNNILSGNIDTSIETNYVRVIIGAAVNLVISAAYFIYTWTSMRGTVGMKALGMQVGNFPDGKTLAQDQAIRRWIALGGPFALVQVLNPLPALGGLISLAAFGYVIYLLYTTSQSPTKQGFHDKFANSVIVKASRVA